MPCCMATERDREEQKGEEEGGCVMLCHASWRWKMKDRSRWMEQGRRREREREKNRMDLEGGVVSGEGMHK